MIKTSWLTKSATLGCLSLLLTLAPGVQAAKPAGATINVRDFFRSPAAASPKLSPSGQKIAMLIPGEQGRMTLGVADISTPTRFVGIARFSDADIANFGWVNDKRLYFSAVDLQSPVGDQVAPGLFAVDVDGSDFTKLIRRRSDVRTMGASDRNLLPEWNLFHSAANDGSDDVFISRHDVFSGSEEARTAILRLDTRTRAVRNITPVGSPEKVMQWLLDRRGEPRVAVTNDSGTKGRVLWRTPSNNEWTVVSRFDVYEPKPDSWTPLAIDSSEQLYVSAIEPSTMAGAQTSAVFRLMPKPDAPLDKPLLSLKGYDFEGKVLIDAGTGKTLGIRYLTDAIGVAWFDPDMKAVQQDVDKQLDGTVNYLTCDYCSQARHLIVTAYSDRQSPVHFLYERATRKLQLLAASRPWLDSARMAEQDFVRVKARDGQEFPVLVTRPQGKGPWPTVVLVHGGPFVRGEQWGFDPDAQFLASRGYLVVQPEFRGSTGYGHTLFKAGWKQWGLTMQDDVTDATRWAIQQGLADPKRVAIAGASYGGYATMMGLAKEPELYKAGINWVGVTDISMMYDVGWSDFMGGKWMRYGMPKMIGDPEGDATQLRATSPLRQAARIKQPVLMAYGSEDLRVPLPHGVKMRDALQAAGNKDVEWRVYEGEGHGWMLEENKIDFWTRVEKFLARHLAQP